MSAAPAGGVAALRRFIRWVMRDTLYLHQFQATIQSQNEADDTCDVLPDDARVKGSGLGSVPIRHGLPGVRVIVKQGARCLLGFEGGDPKRPYVALWRASDIERIEFNGGGAGLARVGDLVTVYWPPITVLTGTVNGLPFVGTAIMGSQSMGMITSGSTRVLAGD